MNLEASSIKGFLAKTKATPVKKKNQFIYMYSAAPIFVEGALE